MKIKHIKTLSVVKQTKNKYGTEIETILLSGFILRISF